MKPKNISKQMIKYTNPANPAKIDTITSIADMSSELEPVVVG